MSRVRIPLFAHLIFLVNLVTTIEALILGMVQGLTEFLPVSSSGHLTLFQALFGYRDLQQFIVFDLVCHLGTLGAIFLVFWRAIWQMITEQRTRLMQVILGTLPLFPLVLLIKPIKAVFDQPQYLGCFFLLTAALLYAGIRWGFNRTPVELQKTRWRDPLAIGLFQAAAILPGVSRSGATISGARLLGWSGSEALTFSFLLAIPAILGGVTVELLQIFLKPEKVGSISFGWLPYLVGFTTSFLFGWGALLLLKQLAAKQQFMYFVWYCLAVGIFALMYFNA